MGRDHLEHLYLDGDNIKMDLTEIGYDVVEGIQVIVYRVH
jgi:hypothetical protein